MNEQLIHEKLDRIEEQQVKIEKLLTGNGTPERGVIVRLDRLEQDSQRRRWLDRVVLGAAIVALVGAFLAKFGIH